MDVPSVDDPGALGRLREVLDHAGFTEQGIRDVLGVGEGYGLGPIERPLYRRRLQRLDPLELLTALFVLGDPVPAAEGARLLDLDRLTRIGVLERSGDGIRSPLELKPFEGLVFAGEPHDPRGSRPDYVPSLHADGRSVAHLMITHGGQMLDVGTGCGALALSAAARSSHATGTDINPRALGFARFNALLNSVENVSWLEGSWFEPVRGRRFDLIVCNPPYAIGPDRALTFRDAGTAGEEVTRRAVQSAAESLADGGHATVLGNWVIPDGLNWWDVVVEWTRHLSCDVWILCDQFYDPAWYAATWNRQLGEVDPAAYELEFERWVESLERAGIRAIAEGTIVMRKRASVDTGWSRWASQLSPPAKAAADQLQAMFAGVDVVECHTSTPVLLSHAFRATAGQYAVQTCRCGDGTYAAHGARVSMEDGAGIEVEVDPRLLPVLFKCDGRRPLQELIAAAAREQHVPEPSLTEAAATAVPALVQTGLLVIMR